MIKSMLPYLKVSVEKKNRFLCFIICLFLPVLVIIFGVSLRLASRYKRAELLLRKLMVRVTKIIERKSH